MLLRYSAGMYADPLDDVAVALTFVIAALWFTWPLLLAHAVLREADPETKRILRPRAWSAFAVQIVMALAVQFAPSIGAIELKIQAALMVGTFVLPPVEIFLMARAAHGSRTVMLGALALVSFALGLRAITVQQSPGDLLTGMWMGVQLWLISAALLFGEAARHATAKRAKVVSSLITFLAWTFPFAFILIPNY